MNDKQIAEVEAAVADWLAPLLPGRDHATLARDLVSLVERKVKEVYKRDMLVVTLPTQAD